MSAEKYNPQMFISSVQTNLKRLPRQELNSAYDFKTYFWMHIKRFTSVSMYKQDNQD